MLRKSGENIRFTLLRKMDAYILLVFFVFFFCIQPLLSLHAPNEYYLFRVSAYPNWYEFMEASFFRNMSVYTSSSVFILSLIFGDEGFRGSRCLKS